MASRWLATTRTCLITQVWPTQSKAAPSWKFYQRLAEASMQKDSNVMPDSRDWRLSIAKLSLCGSLGQIGTRSQTRRKLVFYGTTRPSPAST